jgi:glycosyltransferase involved in cell wall biosynthesis
VRLCRKKHKKMPYKTLHIDDQLAWRGGQSQALHLLRGLAERGHHAELVSPPGSVLAERAREAGITVHDVPMKGEADLLAVRRIARVVREGKHDIVHMHSAHAHMLGAMACAFNLRPKCIVHRRVDFPINRGPLGVAALKYHFRINAYVAVCEAIKQVLVAGGVNPKKIFVVHSGAAPPKIADHRDVRREMGILPDEKVVGTIGALVDHKGQRYLIEAAPLVLKKCPKTVFVIVGEGELEGELRRLAARLHMEKKIIFPGFQEYAGNYLRVFDVFAAPSHMDGLNNSVVEAMIMKRPVVGTRAGGIPEIVEHEKSGLLVPPKDPTALADAIIGLLRNPEKADRLAFAGCRRAKAHFTMDHMVEGNIEVYNRLLKK